MARILLFFLLVFVAILGNLQAEENFSAFSQKTFSTDLTFIMDFSYMHRDMQDEINKGLDIPGFIYGENKIDDYDDSIPIDQQGFSLNYGKMVFKTKMDQYFELYVDMAIEEYQESSGAESKHVFLKEAYLDTISLPAFFDFKAGRFLSSFGGFNQKLQHNWFFFDKPMVEKVFFGYHGFLEKGVQIGWNVPLPFKMKIGGEILEGENSQSFGTSRIGGSGINANLEIESSGKPNALVFFLENDVNLENLKLDFGISYAMGEYRKTYNFQPTSGDAYNGDVMLFAVDLSVKYNFDAYRYLLLEGEFIYRMISGTKYVAGPTNLDLTEYDLEMNQSGFYSQLILKPFINWRFGGRYEMLLANTIKLDGEKQESILTSTERGEVFLDSDLVKYSVMVDYNLSEFSRIRLQYNNDQMHYDELNSKIQVQEIILQFTMSYGTKGSDL